MATKKEAPINQNDEFKGQIDMTAESDLKTILDNTPFPTAVVDTNDEHIFYWSKSAIKLFGYDPKTTEEWYQLAYPDPQYRQDVIERWKPFLKIANNSTEAVNTGEYRISCKDGTVKICELYAQIIPDYLIVTLNDITERKKAEKNLKEIEWLLEKQKEESQKLAKNYIPDYGDVTKLNTERTILDSVGADTLKTLCSDIMDLLDTSIAIYEINGDYAFGQFDSTWCQTMDLASFQLCKTHDNKKALSCGKWLCHENCWNDSAQEAIKSHKTTDIECVGGIHLYAVPIFAGKNLIGVINMGYGKPPTDERTLKELAKKYHVKYEVLIENATKYKARPTFIIENAKKRLHTVAQLIGKIVDSAQKEKKIKESDNSLRDAQRIANIGNWSLDLKTGKVNMSDEMLDLIGLTDREKAFNVSNHEKFYTPESWQKFNKAVNNARATGEVYEIEMEFSDKNATYRYAIARGEAVYDDNNNIIALKGTLQDITGRKIAEQKLENFNQQLLANTQQLRAANQQLSANEQQLSANEDKFRNIFENSTNLFYSHSPEHIMTYVSPQVKDILGYTPEEIMIKWTDLASDHPINEIGFQNTIKAIKTGQRQPTYNLELVKKSGEKIWVEVREFPVTENGKVTAIVGSLTDITKRIKANDQLIFLNKSITELISIDENQLVFDYFTKSIHTVYSNAIILYMSIDEEKKDVKLESVAGLDDSILAKVINIFGYNPIGNHFKLTKEHKEIFRQGHLHTHEGGLANFPANELPLAASKIIKKLLNIHQIYTIGINKNNKLLGGLHIFTLNGSEIEDGDFLETYAAHFSSVVENQNFTAKLQESEAKFSELFRSVNDAIFMYDTDTYEIFEANEATSEIYGYSHDELIGMSCLKFSAEEKESKTVAKAIKNTDKIQVNFRHHKKKDGTDVFVQLNTYKIQVNGKNTFYTVCHDITRSKIAEVELTKAKEKAEESEEKFKTIFNMSHSLICVADTNTSTFKFINPAFERVLGYSKEELLSKPFLEFIHPDDVEPTKNIVEKQLQAGIAVQTFENRYKCKNGDYCWLNWNSYPLPEKGITYAIALDVTEIKKTEQALKTKNEELTRNNKAVLKAKEEVEESRILLKTIINATPDLVWLKDINGIFLNCNKRFEDFFGKNERDIVGKTDYDFVDKKLADFFRHNDKLAMNAGKPTINEEEITFASDGHSEILETIKIPLVNKNNDIIGILGVGRDITNRKKVEEKLKEINNKLINHNIAFESSIDGIAILDKNQNYTYLNQAHAEMYGYSSAKELEGKSWEILYNKDELKRFENKIFPEFIKKGFWRGEAIGLKKQGTTFNQEISLTMLESGGLICVVRDISEQKQAERELIKAKEKAEESDMLKTAFLANMSHEIRTPMNGILGFTSLLEKPHLSDETRDQYIQIIKKSGERMLDTVNDLIIVSKIETGQEELHDNKENPCALLEEIFDFFKPSAESKGLEFKFDHLCSSQHDLIQLDATKFNSIVSNLIKNAIKFTDKGSIIVTSNKDDKKVTISVKDTGHGIPKDRQDAIFDRFVQADLGDKNALEGSGLGLSIVKAYVEMMGGTISLESEPGKGSCFTVELPIKKMGEEKAMLPKKVLEGSDIILNKILIAEDDEISYQHLAISLEPYAKQILRAVNGEEAVQMAKDNKDCDLILMDIKMPKMDGLEASKKIREFNKSVHIISQTAYALSEDKENSLAAGCNGYISKPINIQELLFLIKNRA